MSNRIMAYLLILAMALQILPISAFGTESADRTVNDLAVEITHVSLNPGKDALGFKAKVTGSVESVTEIGFCFRVNGGPEKVYTVSKTPVDGVFTARVQNILANNGGEATLEAYAFVRMGDVTVTSEWRSTSMKQTLQTVDATWHTAGYTQTQKLTVRELCGKYNAQVQLWNLNNIFGSFFGTAGEYTTTSHFDLSADTGANTGEVTVSENGIAFGYVDGFAQDSFYFETKIHANGVLSTESWPKFGLFVEAANIREYFYVDMTTTLTANMVGRMTNTNEVDNWDNINTATVDPMAFSGDGENVILGVLKDGSMLHFFVDGQYVLSYLSQIQGAAVTGVFSFNTGLTVTEYYTDISVQTKEEKLALLPVNNITGFFGKTYDYVSTSNIDLSADTGANNGTVTVSKNGVALGYVNNFVEENFYFETQIHVNDILATENWPKFGLLVEAANIREYFYVDMTTALTANVVGRMTNTNEVDAWNSVTTATIDKMAFSGDGETVTLGILKDGGVLHFFVDGQYALSHISSIKGGAVAGIFSFNTGLTLTEYFTDLSAETKEAKLALVPADSITLSENYFTQTAEGVYSLLSQTDDDTKVDNVMIYGSELNAANYSVKGTLSLADADTWGQARIVISADEQNGYFIALEKLATGRYQIFTMAKAAETDWNDWRLIAHQDLNDSRNSIDFEIIVNGGHIYFLIDDQICYESNRVSMTTSSLGFSASNVATATVVNLSAEVFANSATAEGYAATKPMKPYESRYQSRMDALYQEYIVEQGCAGKGGTLILGDSNMDFWDAWESQTGLTNYVDGYNVGIAGSVTQDWIYAYDKLIAPFEADRFVILVGANDVNTWGDSGAEAAAKLETLFEKIHADHPHAEIYYIYTTPSPSAYANGSYTSAKLGELVSCTKDLCASLDYVHGVDVFAKMVTEDRLNANAELFSTDKVHMSEAGYAVFSEHLYEMIFADDSVNADQMTETDKFVLYDGNLSAPILMDAQYDAADVVSTRTYTQVARAVGDLRQDVAMVNGAIDYKIIQQIFADSDAHQAERLANAKKNMVPALIHSVPEGTTYTYAVIVGAIGESAMIDQIIASGKLPEAQTIQGEWEAYVIKEVIDPVPGVKNALVIAGSDARGTIYGIYTISEKIGVSPYYWYSDVTVQVQDTITLDYEEAFVDDGPDVKYRGIFINDEESSNAWAKAKFNEDAPGTNYYRRVFEMTLRLKANTLWPAMHGCSVAFNNEVDSDGIPVNSVEAAKYGVVMSSSHCDILLRNNVGEWYGWIDSNASKYGSTAYDFTINEEALLDYWGERLVTVKDFESILPIGIRGVHDNAFECANLDKYEGSTTEEKKVNMLIHVITKQRELIYDIYGTEPQNVPQVYIAYKEANDLYNAGVNEFLAWDGSQDFNGDGIIDWRDNNSDIILMYAEDNQNYLRQTLSETDAQRSGGGGLYYHISYCGQPRSVMVTDDVQLSVMVEEMRRAYETGSDEYWILNVGDIKPGEIAMELFLKQAWDVETYGSDVIESKFLTELGKRDFHLSDEMAAEFAAAMDEYYQLTGIKKQAFFYIHNGDTFIYNEKQYNDETTLFNVWANGDEGMRFVERCNAMMDTLDKIYENLPEEDKASFYQMAYFMADLLRNSAQEHISYWKNQLAASQGRFGSSLHYAKLGLAASSRITDSVARYNSQSNNKWTHMMNLDHYSVVYEQIGVERYTILSTPSNGVGAACENQEEAGSGTLRFNSASPDDRRYFDVFDKNNVAQQWIAETSADWIVLSSYSGQVTIEQRVLVSIDWSKLSTNGEGTITVYNVDENGEKADAVATFEVKAVAFEGYGDNVGYVAANGYAAIEFEHYTEKVNGDDGSYWSPVVSNGQHGDTMKALPSGDHHTEDWAKTAQLHYSVYFEEAGTYELTLNRLPTLSEGTTAEGIDRSMNVAVGVGTDDPIILTGNRICDEKDEVWRMNVLRQLEALTCEITVNKGWNDIVIYRVDSDMMIDRMIIRTIDGATPVGLIGPWESPNNIPDANTAPAYVASLPEESDYYLVLTTVKQDETVDLELADAVSVNVFEQNVLAAQLADGMLTLTGKRAGKTLAEIVFTNGSKGYLLATVSTRTSGDSLYNEENGLVVFDAADAMANGSFTYSTDSDDGIHTWEYLNGGISVLPDNGSNWQSTSLSALNGNAPSLTYGVMINNAGSYYLYTNTSVPNNAADSYHIFVDGEYWHTVNTSQFPIEKYSWYNAGNSISLTAGKHTITVYAREDGLAINQFALSTNGSESLEGLLLVSKTVAYTDTISMNDLENVSLMVGGVYREIGIVAVSGSGKAVTLSVENGNESVVTAVLTDNVLKLTPVSEGEATITVVATVDGSEPVEKSFTVTVTAAQGELAYLANENGDILINAVDAIQQKTFAQHSNDNQSGMNADVAFTWESVAESGEIGSSIQLIPIGSSSNKLNFTVSDPTGNPSLTYTVWVSEAGEYYLNVFSNSPNNNADSFFFGVNNTYLFASQNVLSNKSGGTNEAVGEKWFCYDKQAVTLEAGYNTIHIWARESGVLLRQILLSPVKQTSLTDWMTPSAIGSPSTETVMQDALHYKADGTAYEDGVTIEAWEDSSAGWDHAGSTYKTYIGSATGAFVGDFTVCVNYNTKAHKTVSGNTGYTTRVYMHDYSNSAAYWIFNIPWTSADKANNSVLGSPTSTATTTIPSKEAAIDIFKDCDIALTIKRQGTVVSWVANVTAGEGTSYAGQTFTTQFTLTGVTSEILQLALCNRAYAEYTVNDIKISGELYVPEGA